MLPEVVLLAQPHDALRRNADDLVPQFKRFLIVLIDGGPKPLGRNLQCIGEEFPRPRNRLLLEIVAKGEVAQHLKEGAVAGSVSDALKVGGADALLAGGDAAARRNLLAGEELLHGRHAGVDEQERRVIVRNQRERGKPQMPLGFKKGEILLTQVVQTCPFHTVCLSSYQKRLCFDPGFRRITSHTGRRR